MPWLRTGDNAATYPMIMMVAGFDPDDDRLINEVFGWLVRCAAQSAGHMTDNIVDFGTAKTMGFSRTSELIRICTAVGLITEVIHKGMRAMRIIDDAEFLHIRTRAQVLLDRRRNKDNADGPKKARILLRDGIACRWCGISTNWNNDNKSARAGELDHLHIDPDKETADHDLVVSCRACNRTRGGNPDAFTRTLRPVPLEPLYSLEAAAIIKKHLNTTVQIDDQRADTTPAPAPIRDQRPGSTEPAPAVHQDESEQRPDGPSATALSDPTGAPQSGDDSIERGSVDPRSQGSGFTGSGRDGPGRAGKGQNGSGGGGKGRRRGRRGGRGGAS